MRTTILQRQRGLVNLVGAILGLGLLVVLGFSLISLFASRTSNSPQTASRPQVPTSQQPSAKPTSIPEPTRSPTPTIVARPTDDPTSGWRLVVDNELGVSFKIPPDWTDFGIKEGEFANTHIVGNTPTASLMEDPTGSGVLLNVRIVKKILFTQFRDQTPQSYFAHLKRQPKGVWRHEDMRYRMRREDDLTVAGYPAAVQAAMPSEDAQIENFHSYTVYFIRGSSVYELSAMTSSERVWQQYKPVFIQILQTLHFP